MAKAEKTGLSSSFLSFCLQMLRVRGLRSCTGDHVFLGDFGSTAGGGYEDSKVKRQILLQKGQMYIDIISFLNIIKDIKYHTYLTYFPFTSEITR